MSCRVVLCRVRMSELTDALDKKGQDMEALHRCTKILSHPILSYIP